MLAHYEAPGQAPDGEWMARLKLVLAAPAIRGEYLKVTSEMQEALAEAIAARTGTDTGQARGLLSLSAARSAGSWGSRCAAR